MKTDKKGKKERAQRNIFKKLIWESPKFIERIFNDKDWIRYVIAKEETNTPSLRMLQQINQALENQAKKAASRNRTIRLVKYSVAASLLFTLGVVAWNHLQNISTTEITANKPTLESEIFPWEEIRNDTQKIKQVFLPDSSEVQLYANSAIRFENEFKGDTRQIHLEGKAYFEVRKDPTKPFEVHAGGTRTTALGTSFTINTHASKTQTSIVLHTGKVSVNAVSPNNTFRTIYLSKVGEQILFNADTQLAHRVDVAKKQPRTAEKVTRSFAQTGTVLTMENIPLSDVIDALNEAYKVQIVVKDNAVDNITYTGTIDTHQDQLENVLTVICMINELRYARQEDGTYQIRKGKKQKEDDEQNQNL